MTDPSLDYTECKNTCKQCHSWPWFGDAGTPRTEDSNAPGESSWLD